MTASPTLPHGKVTLLFTDIEDSTPMNTALGNELYKTRMQEPHFRVLRDCIREAGGVENGTPAGDSLLAVFPTPDAGLACARAMQERLQSAPVEMNHAGTTWRVKVRIGVHTAERQMSLGDDGLYHGEDINKAARVMSQGKGGQVLVSPTCHKEAGSRQAYTFYPWPDRMLKGYQEPTDLHEMLWQRGQKPQEPGQRWIPAWMRKYGDAYIERKQPMREIFKWLDGNKAMLIVHGPGGMGKTRLCVQAVLRIVGRFEGRVYGIALDKEFGANPEAVTPELLAAAIARSVKAPDDVLLKPLERLVPYLEGLGEILVFLDNAESVFNVATEKWLAEIVPVLWKARWIVSSRRTPGLPDIARPYALVRLETPQNGAALAKNPCYALFKARLVEKHLTPDTAKSDLVARILQQTEGFPLAIELVAARCEFKTLEEIANGLTDSRLEWQRMLGEAGQRRGNEDRHESMEACIHWSVQMLPQEEQEAYTHLHLWAHDFDADAAQTIGNIPFKYLAGWQTMSLLERLERNGATRYRLLPVFREYAQRRAEALQVDVSGVQQKYVDYYVPLTEANQNINEPVRKAVLDLEWRNMTTAAKYTDDADTLLRLVDGLYKFSNLSIYGLEVAWLYERTGEAARTANNTRGEAHCSKSSGDISLARSYHETARQQYELALSLYRQVEDVQGEANCIRSLGDIALRCSNHKGAYQQYELALPLFRLAGDVLGEANCILRSGSIALERSDHEAAIEMYGRALSLYRQVGDVLGEANCTRNFGRIAQERSEYDNARRYYEHALSLYRQVGGGMGEANCNFSLGNLALECSDHEAAVQQYELALPLYQQVGDVLGEANCIRSLGEIALARSEPESARKRYEQALELYERIPEPYSIGVTHVRLAQVASEAAERKKHVQAAREAWTGIDRPDLIATYLDAASPE